MPERPVKRLVAAPDTKSAAPLRATAPTSAAPAAHAGRRQHRQRKQRNQRSAAETQ